MSACHGKYKHATRESAVDARQRMAERDPKIVALLVPYRCSKCNLFHLGTARDARRRLTRYLKKQGTAS